MRLTPTQRLPVPLPDDPAAGGPALDALATAADAKFNAFDAFPGFLRTPTAITWGTSTGFPIPPNTEQPVAFGIEEFANVAGMITVANLDLPVYAERWWWYVGTNVLMQAGAAANTRFTLRLYVDETDPATGVRGARKVLRRNYYSAGVGVEQMFLDWFVLTGGGTVQVTISHTHTAGLDLATPSWLWATRVGRED